MFQQFALLCSYDLMKIDNIYVCSLISSAKVGKILMYVKSVVIFIAFFHANVYSVWGGVRSKEG